MAGIKIIEQPIMAEELADMARERFGDMVKVVVDVQRGVMAIGGDLHADEESVLLQNGSKQADLWGINIYPEKPRGEWVEFDSMINIRPSQGNRSRTIENAEVRKQILAIVGRLIP